MIPLNSFLIGAVYDWIIANTFTPYIRVDTLAKGVIIPPNFANTENLVLNIGPSAVRNLTINTEKLTCNATFGGTLFQLQIPVNAIKAIYAAENNMGMELTREEAPVEDQLKKSKLRLVKADDLS